jgi:cytochrome c
MKYRYGVAVGAVVLGLYGLPVAIAAPAPLDIKDESGATLSGDPDAGAQVFKKCMACHSAKAGENRVGPSLSGVIGRTAGTVAGYTYSAANKNSGITWTEQKIFDYLLAPNKMVQGTKMVFPGLPKPQDRADVIAYLKTFK